MFLAIDTSGNQTSIALASSNQRLEYSLNSEHLNETVSSHSLSLASQVSELLLRNNFSVKDLSGIILGAGPGSFTGLRIGFSFAKGLALSLGLPIFTCSSLRAAAWCFVDRECQILAIDDARRDQYFAAFFDNKKQALSCTMSDRIIEQADIRDWQDSNPNGLLVSANSMLQDRFPALQIANNLSLALGQIATFEKFAAQGKKTNKEFISVLAQLEPTYIRAVSAKSIIERSSRL